MNTSSPEDDGVSAKLPGLSGGDVGAAGLERKGVTPGPRLAEDEFMLSFAASERVDLHRITLPRDVDVDLRTLALEGEVTEAQVDKLASGIARKRAALQHTRRGLPCLRASSVDAIGCVRVYLRWLRLGARP